MNWILKIIDADVDWNGFEWRIEISSKSVAGGDIFDLRLYEEMILINWNDPDWR